MGSTRPSILEILRNANSSVSVLRSSQATLPWTGEMDAQTTRDLALLAALSLFCAGFTWSWGYVIWVRSFLRTGADMGQLVLKRAAASRLSGGAMTITTYSPTASWLAAS